MPTRNPGTQHWGVRCLCARGCAAHALPPSIYLWCLWWRFFRIFRNSPLRTSPPQCARKASRLILSKSSRSCIGSCALLRHSVHTGERNGAPVHTHPLRPPVLLRRHRLSNRLLELQLLPLPVRRERFLEDDDLQAGAARQRSAPVPICIFWTRSSASQMHSHLPPC